VLATVLALAVPAAEGAESLPITQTSIGAKLGLGKADYKRIFGKPARLDRLEGGLTRFVFARVDVEVYFAAGRDAGIWITTWNRSFRTAAGSGPCSTVADLSAVYGARLRPVRLGSEVIAYRLGKLAFAVAGKRVGSVVLGEGRQAVFAAASTPDCGAPGA